MQRLPCNLKLEEIWDSVSCGHYVLCLVQLSKIRNVEGSVHHVMPALAPWFSCLRLWPGSSVGEPDRLVR